MDKLREEFEQWFLSEMGIDVSGMRNADPDTNAEWHYDSGTQELSAVVTAAFKAWCDSRARIVVELPKPHAHLIWIQAGYAPDDYWDDVEVSRSEKDKCCDGSDRYPVYAEHEIAESLRSIGLSIKGE